MWQKMLQIGSGSTPSKTIVELVLPYMTSITNAVGTAIHDSACWGNAFSVFDNDTSTTDGTSTTTGWNGFTFNKPTCVKSVSFTPYPQRITGYSIEASNDAFASTPTVLATGNANENGTTDISTDVDLSTNENYYTSYRVRCTSNKYGYAYTMKIIKFFGYSQ